MYEFLTRHYPEYKLDKEVVSHLKEAIMELHLKMTRKSFDLKCFIIEDDLSSFKTAILSKNDENMSISIENLLKDIIETIPFSKEWSEEIQLAFTIKYLDEYASKSLINPFCNAEMALIKAIEDRLLSLAKNTGAVSELSDDLSPVYSQILSSIFQRRLDIAHQIKVL
ncbi:MAG TPA: hypothetical protein PKD96_00315 [Candidatus Absconditabacterales bacterium]|nr:hypothetical protein [Candidatus Absconditabacterales bacterium]HMT26723.1 hypothetical protein [Candidatus Absconditabacterales bacterium]